ncbi:MAG: NOL1/NOP2/sun family putative RNA methylase [Nanoarchaeota archaeon]
MDWNTDKKVVFKEKFVKRYSQLTDFEEFKKYSLEYQKRSIRVNTLKISVEELRERLVCNWELTQIPWCKEGFWIVHKNNERRDIGNTIEHSLGYYYIQESASMIPAIVLEPKLNEVILDICASPGSKSTQIAQYMDNTGILISNDYKGDRLAPLGINIQRMGITNTIMTLMEGRKFKGYNFDRILLDAPCSGTGTIRKSFKTITIWNPDMIKRLARQQRQLIDSAFMNLKEDGVMVYSTCSLEPEEDEEVIDFLLSKYQNARLEGIEINIKRSSPILEFEGKSYNPEIRKCLRIWPQDNNSDGFFVARIRKVSNE